MDHSPPGSLRYSASELSSALDELLDHPRGAQPELLAHLRERYPPPEVQEAWNTAFGEGSLFDAWTRSSVASAIYEANAASLRPLLDARPGWRVLEVGGGDGRLWRSLLRADDVGELVVVDPAPEVGPLLRQRLPAGVRLRHLQARVEELVEASCPPVMP